MKKKLLSSITKKINDVFLLPVKLNQKRIFEFRYLVFILFLSPLSVNSQQQITENLKCTYVANSFGGGGKWVQNFIENMSVTKDGTVNTTSYWDEAHREYGVYTKCDVIGNSNKKSNSLVANDCNGNTWTIINPYLRFMRDKVAPVPTGALAPYISCSDGREIRSIIDPSAISIDNNCKLMVADNGPDQNIKVFDISGTGTPVVVNTIGVKGGALAGPQPGIIEPLKFWGLRGMGTDSNGNLWVGQSGFPSQVGGGTDLRHFDTNLNMDCQMLGLAFVQSMDADPLDPTKIYSSGECYEVDYNVPAGDLQAHWKYRSQTLDPFKYPDDPRVVNSLESTFIRYIDGKKFMFLTNMYTEFVAIYRFDGEIAVPCAFFCADWDGQWKKYIWQLDKRPKFNGSGGLRWLWRDNNGDGQVQKDEFSIFNLGYPYVKGLDIDKNGNISITSRTFCYFPANGLDKNGVPNYSVANMVKTNPPYTIGGGDMSRVKYVDETDIMYFGTADWGYPSFNQVLEYKNWSKGVRTPRILSIGANANTFTADDKYIYIVLGAGGKYTGKTGEIDIWDAETLEPVGYILPGEEVFGQSGMNDLSYGIKVSKLPSGERIIIIEEDAKGKNIIYKWCPDGNCVTPDFSIELTSPKAGTAYLNNGNVIFEASVTKDNTPISKVEFYADNLKIGESSAIPYDFVWENPEIGTHIVYAKAIGQNNASAKSNYFGLKITDGTPEIFLQSPSAYINYTMLDTIVFLAAAHDNGSVQKVEFFRNNILIGEVSTPPYRFNWTNPKAGQSAVYAKITDNDGNSSTTPSVTINVTNQISIPFISPVNDTILIEGTNCNVQLNTASIPNFKSVTYYNGSEVLSTVSSAPYLYEANNIKTGMYNFSALVTLNDGGQIRTTGPGISVIPQVFDCDHTGILNLDLWKGIKGTTINEIPMYDSPTISKMTDTFEGPTNFDDNYGERICGYLCPPQTGEYIFWTSGNDNNQFRIKMPDADTLRVVAYAGNATGVRSWDEMQSQKSEPVMLQEGQMYIVEGLLKEGSGDDSFAVGWQLPDGTFERPIPGKRLTPLYNPLTLNDDVSIQIVSPTEGAVLNKNDSITIIAEVQKGQSDITSMKFYVGTLKMNDIGTDKTPESNRFSFKTKLSTGNYKITAKGMYRQLIPVSSDTVSIRVKTLPNGIDDINSEGDFEMFPNPFSKGTLSVKLPDEATRLSIYDITGKLVFQENVTKKEYLIDQSEFKSEGVYIVNVLTKKNSFNKRVIVKK